MLMLNEINTAVQYGAKAVWIVLNDARYGMIDQGMRTQGFEPVEVHMPRVDFGALRPLDGRRRRARRRGARARRRHAAAMAAPGPFVIDVQIDPTQQAPISGRIRSLIDQGAHLRVPPFPTFTTAPAKDQGRPYPRILREKDDVMNTSVGIRSLAVAFPDKSAPTTSSAHATRRLVARAEAGTLARVFSTQFAQQAWPTRSRSR